MGIGDAQATMTFWECGDGKSVGGESMSLLCGTLKEGGV